MEMVGETDSKSFKEFPNPSWGHLSGPASPVVYVRFGDLGSEMCSFEAIGARVIIMPIACDEGGKQGRHSLAVSDLLV